jgi:hypothetical protein
MERIQWVFNAESTMVPIKIRIRLEREKYFTNRKGLARSGCGCEVFNSVAYGPELSLARKVEDWDF